MRFIVSLSLAAALSIQLFAAAAEQQQGILVMAHGGDAAWNAAVEAAVAPVASHYPTEIAYGMAVPSALQDAIGRLEARGVSRIAVVRLFISGDSFLEQTEYILGLRNEEPPPIHMPAAAPSDSHAMAGHADMQHGAMPEGGGADHGAAMGHAMEPLRQIQISAQLYLSEAGLAESTLVDQILLDRVNALSVEPNEECVLILGHGPGDDAENERWLAMMRLRAQQLHSLGRFEHVQCETLREDWPERREESEQRIRRYIEDAAGRGIRVLVVPFRVAGFGPYAEVLENLDYVADGQGFCPHPNIADWITQTAGRCFDQH